MLEAPKPPPLPKPVLETPKPPPLPKPGPPPKPPLLPPAPVPKDPNPAPKLAPKDAELDPNDPKPPVPEVTEEKDALEDAAADEAGVPNKLPPLPLAAPKEEKESDGAAPLAAPAADPNGDGAAPKGFAPNGEAAVAPVAAAGADEKLNLGAVAMVKEGVVAAVEGALEAPPNAPILRAKSADVSLMPCVSHGRADDAGGAGGAAAAGFALLWSNENDGPEDAGADAKENEADENENAGADVDPCGVPKLSALGTAEKLGDAAGLKGEAAAPVPPPIAPILRAKSAEVSLMPCVSHGRLEEAAAADFAAAGAAPAAAILRLKSADVSLMPCVSHGRADDVAAGFAAGAAVTVAPGAADAKPPAQVEPEPNLSAGAAPEAAPAAAGAGAADDDAAAAADVPKPNLIPDAPPPPPTPKVMPPDPALGSSPFTAFGFLVSHATHLAMPSSLMTRHTSQRHSLPSGSSLGGLKLVRFAAVSSSSELPMSASESSESTSDSSSSTKSSWAALPLLVSAALLGL